MAGSNLIFSITDWVGSNVRIETIPGQGYYGSIQSVDPNYDLILLLGENGRQYVLPFSSIKHIEKK